MGLIDEQPLTHLTDIHKKVSSRIERLGISVQDEIPFPPYTVDIYLPEYHAAVEIDGPHHNAKKDDLRDYKLWQEYRLYTLRIDIGEAKKASKVKKMVLEFVDEIEELDMKMGTFYVRVSHAKGNGWQE